MFYWLIYILLFLPLKICFPTRVIGRKNLPKGKAIFAPNHQTLFDSPILLCSLHRRMYWLMKKELFENKLLGACLKGMGGIKVDRGKADIEAIKKVLFVLNKKNKPVTIFPTGTRNSSPEEINDIKNGVAMFSVKTNSPIIPMMFIKKPRFFHFNTLVIGKPLDLSKYEGRKADKELYNEISLDLENAMQDLLKQYSKESK